MYQSKKKFTPNLQNKFANSSLDKNLIHMDMIESRLHFSGQVIVHGMHVLIWALDEFVNKFLNLVVDYEIFDIKCKFLKPIFLNELLDLKITNNENIFYLIVSKNDTRLTTIRIKLKSGSIKKNEYSNLCYFDLLKIKEPLESNKNFFTRTGYVDISSIDLKFLKKYYKHFSNFFSENTIRSLQGLSSVIGMIYPGKRSLITEINLQEYKKQKNNGDYLYFKLNKQSEALGYKQILIESNSLAANVDTLDRPNPVNFNNISLYSGLVKKNSYKDHKVLIIGGSRGIGAMMAKLLAYGNAQVIITYKHCEKEARSIAKHKNINAFLFDVKTKKINPDIINIFKNIDSVFYFASTKIFFRRTKKYHLNYKKEFDDIFVNSFKMCLYEILRLNNNLKYCLYPSTSEINNKNSINIEYINSKILAEKVCAQMKRSYPNINIYAPRLEKIITHQTQGFNNNYDLKNNVKYLKNILDNLYLAKF